MIIPRVLLFPRLSLSISSNRGLKSSVILNTHAPIPWWGPEITNGREVVAHAGGNEVYEERLEKWFPATRFRRNDDLILPIREKELGDWKNLTLEEKKLLYRYSFRKTLAEEEAPRGYWKVILAGTLFCSSYGILYFTFVNVVLFPEMPITFSPEYREMEMEKRLVLRKGEFLGHASRYDYENNRWKV